MEELSQIVLNFLKDISHFVNETVMTGFIAKATFHILGFLKLIAEFIIVGLEFLLKILKSFVG